MSEDLEGFASLAEYLYAAIAAQDVAVADQLDAAVRDGLTSFRFESSVAGPVAIVSVAGHDVAEVSLDRLIDLAEG